MSQALLSYKRYMIIICAMRRAFRYTVAALIIAVTMTACGNGDGEANPAIAGEQYEWVALEQLLVPTPLPENGEYGLQAGKFSSAGGAEALRSRILASGLPSSVIPVVDSDGLYWFIVSVGSFESPDDARASRSLISIELGISEQLPLILLPGRT